MSNLHEKLQTASFIEQNKEKAVSKYTTIMLKNEYNDKLVDLSKHYKLPKTKVLNVIISDAHLTITEGDNDE